MSWANVTAGQVSANAVVIASSCFIFSFYQLRLMIDKMGTSRQLSTMSDEKLNMNPFHTIRGLLHDLNEQLDSIAAELREHSEFAGTRPADAKTFIMISRHPRGLTDLAKALGVSRQAAHKSVQRLVEAGVIEFTYAKGSKRDMIAQITEKGLAARKAGQDMALEIEGLISSRIGDDQTTQLRTLLLQLTQPPLKQNNAP